MNIKNQVQLINNMVAKGEIVEAAKIFFSDEAITSDYGNVTTTGRQQMVEKMEGFLGSIAKVNGIKHHNSLVDGNSSASEFTFDFDMKDGSKIYWHEIIKRDWNEEGEVTREEYFKA